MQEPILRTLWADYKCAVEDYRDSQTQENKKIMQAHQAALEAAFIGGVIYQ